MTKQEIFNKVVKHLRQQGRKAVNEKGDCCYRTSDGLKCAAGCLIEDKEYDPVFENKFFGVLLYLNFEDPTIDLKVQSLRNRLDQHYNLIVQLQTIHDQYDLYQWENMF